MENPYVITSYALFEKRATWHQLAHSTAVMQGYEAKAPIPLKKWPEVLVSLVNLCTSEPLEESSTWVETEEWLSLLFDETTRKFDTLSGMDSHELKCSAFTTADGTAYFRLVELMRVLQFNGIRIPRSEIIGRLRNQGWNAPPQGGYAKREGDTMVNVRLWSKAL
jgi:hypothetical protein